MVWVIVIAVIFVVLFLMILGPKAAKSYTDTEKLKDVAWGKGFKRIYFVASALWIGALAIMFGQAQSAGELEAEFMPVALVLILAPIPLYFFIKWIFGGFKKEEEKKK
jgi:O-antigen/teichoic acid export membrane protein